MSKTTKNYSLEIHKAFKFNSAHFIVHDDQREFLHGHNYKVSLVFSSENISSCGHMVKQNNITTFFTKFFKTWSGKILLGKKNNNIIYTKNSFSDSENSITLQCKIDNSVFTIPEKDIVFLDIPQASTECLAEIILNMVINKKEDFMYHDVKYSSVEVHVYEDVPKCAKIKHIFS